MWKVKKVCVSVVVLSAFLTGISKAQAQNDQQESVADAARRSREQKKEASKPATVVTNDTLEPPNAEAPATPVTATAVPGGEQQAAGAAEVTSTSETPAGEGEKGGELDGLKQQIKELQGEVDLVQRQVALANDDFYSKPDFSKDEERKAKLEAMKSDLAQKMDELEQLKAKLPAGTDLKERKPAQSESQSPSGSQSQSQGPQR